MVVLLHLICATGVSRDGAPVETESIFSDHSGTKAYMWQI